MTLPDSSSGTQAAFRWKSYAVRRADKAPLLRFITKALESRRCHIVHASEPDTAPFFIVFETPGGERHGLLAYAFFANSRATRNRPADEHRFQIKYGSNLKGVFPNAVATIRLVGAIFAERSDEWAVSTPLRYLRNHD